MSELSGKVAFVTGGSRGIGAAVVERLVRDGAKVAFTYVASSERAEALVAKVAAQGGEALALHADGADADALLRAVEQARAHFGGVDILVNSAGIFGGNPIGEEALADFDRVMAVNLRAVFVATNAIAKFLPRGGRIITIGSNLAQMAGAPGMGLYIASKAALVGFTRAWARDLGERDITVNIVHPGNTDTDMNPETANGADAARATMAIKRFGRPEQVADLVAWLAAPGSQFMTGSELVIDGGTNA